MVTEVSGKIFQAEQGMRRCKVCEELFTRADAAQHSTAPCQPKPETLAAAVGQSH